MGLLWFNIADEQGFNIIWRYFGWSNQTLACFALWAVTVYLANAHKGYSWIGLAPFVTLAVLRRCVLG